MTGDAINKNDMDFLIHLRKNYLNELPERLERLEVVLLDAERKGDATGERFNTLFRDVHSLKGSGGTYGFFPISTICHKLEDYLKHASEKMTPHKLDASIIPNGLLFVDLLKEYADNLARNNEDTSLIDAKLATLVDSFEEKNQIKVLIVTNSKSLAEFSKQTLKQFGIKSVVLDNSYNALLQLSTAHYDILITSSEMPLLSGSGLIAALRLSDSMNKQIPAILVTANTSTVHNKRNIDPDYLVKKDAQFGQHVEEAVAQIRQNRKAAKQA